jgi:hypothetical protein
MEIAIFWGKKLNTKNIDGIRATFPDFLFLE